MVQAIDIWRNRLRSILGLTRRDEKDGLSRTFSSGVKVSFHDHGAVVLHKTRGLVYSANSTGARILKDLLGDFDPQRTVHSLSMTYEVSKQQAARDLSAFLAVLDRFGFLAKHGAKLC